MPKRRYGTFVTPTEYDGIKLFEVKRVVKGGPGGAWDDEHSEHYTRAELIVLIKQCVDALA